MYSNKWNCHFWKRLFRITLEVSCALKKHVLDPETQSHHYLGFEKPGCVILLSQRETGILRHVNTGTSSRISDGCLSVHTHDWTDRAIGQRIKQLDD